LYLSRAGSYIYCSKEKPQREGFSFLIWAVPLDKWSWIYLLMSGLVLTVLTRGQWIQVCRILLRQECTVLIGIKKYLIIFILMVIVITYGYEGVISSLLTIRPPIISFNTMKELLDHGIKILFRDHGRMYKLLGVFKRENISEDSLETHLLYIPHEYKYFDLSPLLVNGNTTLKIPVHLSLDWKAHLKRDFPHVHCYVAKKSGYSSENTINLHGPFRSVLARITYAFLESGILFMYGNWENYLIKLPSASLGEKLEAEEKGLGVSAFDMTEWRMISIFIVWAALLLLTLLVYIAEYCFTDFIKPARSIWSSIKRIPISIRMWVNQVCIIWNGRSLNLNLGMQIGWQVVRNLRLY